MKLSLNWLKDYIDPKLSTEELSHRLVMAGWEVEYIDILDQDNVLELEITPNRPDCLNILGLAREIGAITSKKVNYPKIQSYKPTKNKVSVPVQQASVTISDKKDCRRYVATLIKEAVIVDSPKNIQERINAVGLKSISNAVDITNFVLMETGQPLHVFDYDKIVGGKIIVRRAKQGERIITIDGIERALDQSILVIADAHKPIAIAGIMGGKDTQVTSSTKNILLESAHFDMTLVRRASRKLGLRSDSSYRFERNVNFEGVLVGANRATDLLLNLTQGKLSARTDVSAAVKSTVKPIKISEADVENCLGHKVPLTKIKNILTRLDFDVERHRNASLQIIPPNFRGDIKETVDLIEEIARIIGFDHMPTSLAQIRTKNLTVDSRPLKLKKLIRQTLLSCGLDETVTLSMTNQRDLAKCNQKDLKVVKVFNPLTIDQELMRPSLLPSLLKVAQINMNRGQRDLRFFEIGKRYSPKGEQDILAILLTGQRHEDWRRSRKESADIFDLKGTLENLFQALQRTVSMNPQGSLVFDSSSSAGIFSAKGGSASGGKGQEMGCFGKIRRDILNNWDIKNQDIYFAEIPLEHLWSLAPTVVKYQSIVEFPAIVRDVSLAVNKEISYKTIEDLCRQNGGKILRQINFIEQYIGDKVSADQKSLVFSLVYQSHTNTLREEEVNSIHERIVEILVKQLGATRR